MKVLAKRRREGGAVLAAPAPVVEGAALMELLVVEVTLDDNRRPSKVARLQVIGGQRILAQLARPKLVRLQGVEPGAKWHRGNEGRCWPAP